MQLKMRSVTCVLILLAACHEVDEAADRGVPSSGELRVADTVHLAESDSVFLAKPGLSLLAWSDGSVYVTDLFQGRILRFGRDGTLLQVIGRPGSGPGEFRSFERLTFRRDSFLVQATATKLQVLDSKSGEFLFARSHPRGFLNSATVLGDTIYLPLFDYSTELGVLKSAVTDLLSPGDTTPMHANLIPFPPEYRSHRALWGFTPVSIAPGPGSDLIAGYPAVPYLVRYRTDGAPIDTLVIPVRSRRGHPGGWLERFDGRALTLQQEIEAFSYLNGLWRRTDGSYLLWYQENRINPDGPNPPYFGRAYLTVLSPDLAEACVDTPIPFPGTEWPNIAVAGDTILALDQVVEEGDSGARSVIRRYLLDTSRCDWIAVEHRPATKAGP